MLGRLDAFFTIASTLSSRFSLVLNVRPKTLTEETRSKGIHVVCLYTHSHSSYIALILKKADYVTLLSIEFHIILSDSVVCVSCLYSYTIGANKAIGNCARDPFNNVVIR